MNKAPELNQTRKQITALDKELLSLLSKRRDLSLDVARSKEIDVRPIRDTQREKELLARLVEQGREHGLDAHFVISLYQSIIEDSVLNQQAYLHGRANPEIQQQQSTIAYLGARGSYSFLAASRFCQRRQIDMIDLGCQSFDEIIKSVELGHADLGFLPIENTSSGSINEVYDVLQHTSLSIVGETTIEVGHCLLTKDGAGLDSIETVFAHPQPISQCSHWLSQHPSLTLAYCSSSAEAMQKVIDAEDSSVAAIGSAEGGALYQLTAAENGLANQKINQSRFIVVARKAVAVPSQLPAKTTLIMATGQKPGALVETLLVLKAHNINMSKLESRPIPGTPWEEMFYLDVDANLATTELQQALKELERLTRFIKVLGCYPCETVKPTQLNNSQLVIEPNSSKESISTPSEDNDAPKFSKRYRQQNTQIELKQFNVGGSDFAAMQQVNLPIDKDVFATKVKQIKESGFQAVLLLDTTTASLSAIEIKEYCHLIDQAGLTSAVQIDSVNHFNEIVKVADMIYLAGKEMYNEELLGLAGSVSTPVLLERNTMASTTDWLASANKILTQGNQQLILVEAGIRSFSNPEQLALDLAGLIEVLSESHLPVLGNVSYAVEDKLVCQQAKALKQLHANGVIINDNQLNCPEQQAELLHRLHQ
ncbi:chorismate mutase [Shewanella sp. 1_MG-2023]|uniref:chorismate mutase n=1 Tax=unclassified Shewanella TaxID=196818 RepID=UPI0026E43BF8|nr:MULTISPECIES: chorismate mutase [unclassified Shewanella]MDO6610030.1 chorismate mutase [Shewanella sp. 7_MG-2023]MDO6769828.1 chorismate mutase [Shewanella sp. 2_MG-2023]MDO6792892.1 chorismate mutase [Shewanella sp. 1_MG-2023]